MGARAATRPVGPSHTRFPAERGGTEHAAATEPQPGAHGAGQQSLGLALDFMRTLWYVDQGLHAVSEAMRRTIGVTGPQRLVIRVVARHSGISPSELAAILHLHPSTVTGIVKRLGARGYLIRGADARDGRRAVLTLTAKGKAVGLKAGPIEQNIENVLRVLGERDVATAEVLLRAIARSLTEAGAK